MFIRAYTAAPLAGPPRPFVQLQFEHSCNGAAAVRELSPNQPRFDPDLIAAFSALVQASCAIAQLLR